MSAAMPASTPSETGRAFYVYAIARAGEARVPEVGGVDPRFPMRVVEHDGLAAIVSEVPLDEFGEERLEENVRRPTWLEEKALRHQRVVARALDADALLPMRFATIFATEEQVRDMLRREQSAFVSLLGRVDGKSEWGVKGLFSRERVRRWIESSRPETAIVPDEGASAGPGRSYFARKKVERLVDEDVPRTTASWAEAAHRRLAAVASEALVNAPQPPEVSSRAEEMLLNGAYLVRREREDAFRGVVAELEEEYREMGVSFELTGPWPAYNFVRLPGEGG